MPAIHLARLKLQSAQLAAQFNSPLVFVRGLHDLLDLYADRTYRPGQSGAPRPLLTSYSPPPPVLRQVQQDVFPFADLDPAATLALCDALWAEPYLEFRLLAAALLGQIPPTPAEPLLQRAREWVGTAPEDRVLDALLGSGLTRLRQQALDLYFLLIEDWLAAGEVYSRQVGLRAIIPLISDPGFENLPTVYRWLTPFLQVAPLALRPHLLDVLNAWVRRAPREAAFLLRQSLSTPHHPDTPLLIRKTLPGFPPDLQESLRAAIRP